ncbi:acylphosphatase [Microbacterium sp. SD291]|uniref:acylphosphatase n=1 Tax=Microbacterium sp. SD291 TaxID=2782007 RepID=UPI001A96A97E|nr:acylphosphatase [Microbacterium sp. SD291]MBO0981479.1 acylphosphatase [Microbacterium sp. SD291]
MTSVRVIVRGRVQGVGFRWFTREAAEAAGATGWVRNRRDGSVEALLRGDAEAVDTVIDAMRDGPRHALVSELVAKQEQDTEPGTDKDLKHDASANGFEIHPTA